MTYFPVFFGGKECTIGGVNDDKPFAAQTKYTGGKPSFTGPVNIRQIESKFMIFPLISYYLQGWQIINNLIIFSTNAQHLPRWEI